MCQFLHDLARFEQFARAHCPPGPSDLVHFVVKFVIERQVQRIFLC